MLREKPIPHGVASHPYKVRSISDLSEELHFQASKHLPAGEEISSIFVIPRTIHPAQYHQPRFQPEQALLFTSNGILSVQESDLKGNFSAPIFIRAESLISMQVSLILLYGRLEIIAANDGESDRIVAEYNTVAHELLEPALHRFLSMAAQRIENKIFDPSLERDAWSEVSGLHMKYANGLSLHAISKDEQLLYIAFQPAIRKIVFLGFTRRIAFPVLFALTNQQFIILGEEQAKGHTDYGWVINYCPLSVIDHIETVPEKQYQRLIIHLHFKEVQVKHEVKVDETTAFKISEFWNKISSRL